MGTSEKHRASLCGVPTRGIVGILSKVHRESASGSDHACLHFIVYNAAKHRFARALDPREPRESRESRNASRSWLEK